MRNALDAIIVKQLTAGCIMKDITRVLLPIIVLVGLCSVALSQEENSGMIWIKTFSPGSSNLDDEQIDKQALAQLDSLLQDSTIVVTFLGAADDLQWRMSGTRVHPHISDAWNDAKRLGRARIVRARYGRGQVGVTDENTAGVKVLWSRGEDLNTLSIAENSSANGSDDQLRRDVDQLRDDVDSVKAALENGKYAQLQFVERTGPRLNWRAQAGFWSWYGGSNRNILAPALGLNVIYNRSVFVVQGGVSPWHSRTPNGKQGEAFVYGGLRRLPADGKHGITYAAGIFRGWEFFTSSDSWSLKSTGITAGPILTYNILELHPAITYAYVDSIFKGQGWHLGTVLIINVNLN